MLAVDWRLVNAWQTMITTTTNTRVTEPIRRYSHRFVSDELSDDGGLVGSGEELVGCDDGVAGGCGVVDAYFVVIGGDLVVVVEGLVVGGGDSGVGGLSGWYTTVITLRCGVKLHLIFSKSFGK